MLSRELPALLTVSEVLARLECDALPDVRLGSRWAIGALLRGLAHWEHLLVGVFDGSLQLKARAQAV